MRFLPGNAQHAGTRSEQQDSFGFSDLANDSFVAHSGVVAVVADGMGGLAHGGAASQAAVRAFLRAYESKDAAEPIPDALLRAINSANHAVVDLAIVAADNKGLGTTLAAVAVFREWLYWISAGDSRVYLFRDGKLTRLTIDHVYANDLEKRVARGEMTRVVAQSHPERAALTSYLGLEKLPHIDRRLRPFPIQPDDYALICSDGLYRALSEEQIAAALGKDPAEACEALVSRALATENYPQDNITVLALKCLRTGLLDRARQANLIGWMRARLAVVGRLVLVAVMSSWFSAEPPMKDLILWAGRLPNGHTETASKAAPLTASPRSAIPK